MRQGLAAAVIAAWMLTLPASARDQEYSDLQVALALADMLRAARTVISAHQELINDPEVGDKGLTGDTVLREAVASFKEATSIDPKRLEPDSRMAELLDAQMQAIRDVMEQNQASINRKGVGFKGFVPAVFGRLVNERFRELKGSVAEIKVTAPPELIRNRKARPDDLERKVIKTRLQAPDWEKGKVYKTTGKTRGRDAFRVLVPEYYTEGCLSCHGEPKGELDVTGYPKEGGQEGDLGGVISVSLFK